VLSLIETLDELQDWLTAHGRKLDRKRLTTREINGRSE
jgi:hypothetical protein